MPIDDLLDEAFGLEKPKMVEIATERLHPPPEVKSDMDLDWKFYADSSEFRRFIYWIRTGLTFRGSNSELDKKLVKTEQTINVVKGLPKDLLIELKEKLKERDEKQ